VLDVDGVSELITRAPGANRLGFTVHGLAAHAGICPEEGLSAIQMAAEAISAMRLGRLDAETTANLGVIEGGRATNIIPDRVVIRGEARSLSPAKLEAQTEAMRRCFLDVAARRSVRVGGREHRARVDVDVHHQYDRLDVPDHTGIVALVQGAAARGPPCTRSTGGGSTPTSSRRGIEVANLACACGDPHGERGRRPRPALTAERSWYGPLNAVA
jgi:tripeptide aminopeptidase